MHTHRRYLLPGDETHQVPTSTSTIRYGMHDVPETGSTPCVELNVEHGTAPRGTSIPFHSVRFGNTSHITPSIPAVEVPSLTQPSLGSSVPI